jgi:hypothetical protein
LEIGADGLGGDAESAQGGREGFGEAVEGVDTFGLDEFDVAQQ